MTFYGNIQVRFLYIIGMLSVLFNNDISTFKYSKALVFIKKENG
jgi:hypothetical protein